jgi:beta-galactosidase
MYFSQKKNLFGLSFLAASFALFLCQAAGAAQTPKMDTILYGASYYYEYMPYERLEKDVRMMKEAGINFVRAGESTWSSFEPREGEFEFSWMERVLDSLHKAGIKVILGTPTYSIPPWLYRKHPEILVTKLGGEKSLYGPRQNMDITNPTYLFYAERIIRKVVSHFKDHPAIIGYQVDNETSSYGTADRNVFLNFVDYLKKKFKTTDELNKAWGLAYWGQLVSDWDDFPPPDGAVNPGYQLEWQRYQLKIVTDFLAWQAAIVNEYKRPDQFITHDFVGGVRSDVDQFEVAKCLDIVATNPYFPVQDKFDGCQIALTGDFCRSLKQNNYLVTETNAQTVSGDSKQPISQQQFPPYDGQVRLAAYSHISSGANMVAYWHWHSLHYGKETYWKGVLSHDLEPNRVYNEVKRTASELKGIGPKLVNLKKKNKVAILYSIDSSNGIKFMPFDSEVNYKTVLQQFYRSLYRLNVGVDFVFSQSANFNDYDIIVVPPLYIASDELLKRLVDFVKGGGHLVLSFKSGFCDEYSRVRWTRMPGVLREACGFYYQEFSNLKQELKLKGDPYKAGDENKVSAWAEFIIPETATALAFYEHPFFGKYPAITRNKYGKGTVTYEGTVLSDRLEEKVMLEVLKLAGLTGPDQELPSSVRVGHGVSDSGRNLHYYLNYSGEEQSFTYPYEAGVDIVTNKSIGKSQTVTLKGWDLVIVEEHYENRRTEG